MVYKVWVTVPFSPEHFVKDVVTVHPSLNTNVSTKIRDDIIERGNTGKRADVRENGVE